jgi:hypothetical protein
VEKLSLLELAGKSTTQWYAVYMDRENPRWWNQYLKKGFQHVQLWRPVKYGPEMRDTFWLVVEPCLEFLDAGVVFNHMPPWHNDKGFTVQRVVSVCRAKKVRDWFHVGPVTCVELAKACLGTKSFWTRTPWQLYKYIARSGGVLIQG